MLLMITILIQLNDTNDNDCDSAEEMSNIMAAVAAAVAAGGKNRPADTCTLHPGKGPPEKPQNT